MKEPTLRERHVGALLGSLVGDALGVPVEFSAREVRDADPVTGMRGYGTWNQPPGTWSDDGAMTLVTADVLAQKGWDSAAMMEGFRRWLDEGWWTARGNVFDIGSTTRKAIDRYAITGDHRTCGQSSETSNGNGSLMRCLPASLWLLEQADDDLIRRAGEVSALTHAHPRSQMACAWHALWCRAALNHGGLFEVQRSVNEALDEHLPDADRSAFARISSGGVLRLPRRQVSSDGYVISTLEASLWCLAHQRTYAETVLAAVNLGGDTDTTAAVVGGMAGWWYGIQAVPTVWIQAIPRSNDVRELAEHFAQRCLHQRGSHDAQ